jgi:hypothetical protein
MSLPTRIQFLDSFFQEIATEFYNAGWFVPDTVGVDIAELYSEEQWQYVIAYRKCYDHHGVEVGEINDNNTLDIYLTNKQKDITEVLDSVPPKEPITEYKKQSKISLQKCSRQFPSLIVTDILGVQPMTATTGNIFELKSKTCSGEPEKLKFTAKGYNSKNEAFYIRQNTRSINIWNDILQHIVDIQTKDNTPIKYNGYIIEKIDIDSLQIHLEENKHITYDNIRNQSTNTTKSKFMWHGFLSDSPVY